jgi:phosphate transport system protein
MAQHLHRAVEKLKEHILSLGGLVERNLEEAMGAFTQGDREAAERVIQADERVDLMEVEVEEECLKLLALHQPVAMDLRFVVSILKINSDLERVGDGAVKIGRTTLAMGEVSLDDLGIEITDLAERAQHMLTESLRSLVDLDCARARAVLQMDDATDAEYRRIDGEGRAGMKRTPALVDGYAALLSVARTLERVADHATNIAEDVVYMVEGGIVRHGRTLPN